ncbi:MAG TPA: hypothetical protein DCQ98_11290 [Planctomycetaceae bacterium]|nr:hypothetical protein [Planctomycetaceae bacterium]
MGDALLGASHRRSVRARSRAAATLRRDAFRTVSSQAKRGRRACRFPTNLILRQGVHKGPAGCRFDDRSVVTRPIPGTNRGLPVALVPLPIRSVVPP